MIDMLSQRAHVLLQLMDERARTEPSDAVIAACEAALSNMPDLEECTRLHIELSQRSD